MKRAKHTSGRIKFFAMNQHGKHARNDLVVYNPIYAKISSCLSSFAISTSLLTCLTLGKYKGTLASSDTARVAHFVLQLTNNETSLTEFIPNTTRNIDFEVKNFEDTIQNEVKLRYRILLNMPETVYLPVDYTLYKVYDNDVKEEISLQNGCSDYINVELTNAVHKYRLELTWRSDQTQIDYQNLTDRIKISIDSEQID